MNENQSVILARPPMKAVRLPKAFRIPGNEVKIYKKGKQVILEPIETTWDSLFESLSEFPEDFMEDGSNRPDMQKRIFLMRYLLDTKYMDTY